MALKLITFSTFEVKWQKADTKYNLRFLVNQDVTPEQSDFVNKNLEIIYPYQMGMVDTSINDKNYELLVIYEDSLPQSGHSNTPFIAQLRKKLDFEHEYESPREPAEITQVDTEKTDKDYIGISSGDSTIAMDGNCLNINAGKTRLGFSQDGGFTKYGDTTKFGLNEDSLGGLFKETGFMHIIPDIPPFAQTKKMPDSKFVTRIAKYISLASQLKKVMDLI